VVAKKTGRPRKDSRAVLADYRDGKAGRIYRDWQAFYENAALPHFRTAKAAAGSANRMMAHKYQLSHRQIHNIVSQGDALMRTIEVQGRANAQKLDGQLQAFRKMHPPIYAAAALLRKPAYEELLEGCKMGPANVPLAIREFSSAPDAVAPDSLQHFAAVLARAFLRAHEVAEREVPGYSERKQPRRR
jgi:hypothetical protein